MRDFGRSTVLVGNVGLRCVGFRLFRVVLDVLVFGITLSFVF